MPRRNVYVGSGAEQCVDTVGIVTQASGVKRSIAIQVAVVERHRALAGQNCDHFFRRVGSVVEYRAAVVVKMVELS